MTDQEVECYTLPMIDRKLGELHQSRRLCTSTATLWEINRDIDYWLEVRHEKVGGI